MKPFTCVVVGEEALLVECTRVLLARGHTVAAVVSPTPDLLAWAENEGLPAVEFGRDLADRLRPLTFDYLFSIANLRMLPEEILALPGRLPVNFHDGPLPRHAGLYATSWAVLEGAREHGVTWHVMNREADTGDLLKQRPVPVPPAATVHDLDVACFDAGVESFAELVDELAAGTAVRTPQDMSLRTYHGRYDGPPRGGVLDWRQPAARIDALVRATAFGRRRNDFGTALLATGEGLVAVRAVEVTDQESTASPGTIVDVTPDALTVAAGDRDVRLTGLAALTGEPLELPVLASALDGRFPHLSEDAVADLVRASRAAHRREARWLRAWESRQPVLPPRLGELRPANRPAGPVPLPASLTGDPRRTAVAAVLAFLTRLTRGGEHTVAVSAPPAPNPAAALVLAPELPLNIPENPLSGTLSDLTARVGAELDRLHSTTPHRRDLPLRHPGLAATTLPVAIALDDDTDADRPLTVRIDATGTVRFVTRAHAAWLAERYALFLDGIADEPQRPLATVSLLDDEERRLVHGKWNDTDEEYPRRATVTSLIGNVADASPDAVAVRFEGREVTYGELDDATSRLAQHLCELGAGPGRLVGVFLERSPELLISLLAVLRSGAAYVPIDPIYPPARIGHMLKDSGAELVLTDAALGGALAEFPVTPVLVGEAPVRSEAPPVDLSSPDAPAYVIYTSGSTGLPKGVQVGHRALVNFLWTMARRPGFTAADSLLALTTVCFDIAGLELYLPLVRGGTVEILPAVVAADGVALRERVERAAPTVLQATPTTWQMLLAAGWRGDPALKALCGGEPLPAELAARLAPSVGALFNMYGPTETTIWSTVERVEPGAEVTVGRPVGNTRAHVLDERGTPVPPGVPGELLLSGDGVADGYLHRPELTTERFVPAPEGGRGRAYRTGDLVRHLPDGRLVYLERIDGLVKLNGFRIELGEVESALRRLPGVRGAVAVVREDRPGERRLIGYVTGVPDGGVLRGALAERLPAYMVPSAVVALPGLPLTPNGKVDRGALPRPDTAKGPTAAVRTDLERRIAGIWCEVLGLERVGAEDNFFDAGGDSLRLTSVVAALRERLGLAVTRLDMFGRPTVRAMAAHVAGEASDAVRPRRPRDVSALAGRRDRKRRRP
ncbi:amino acid adenylation domain-containing protein [Streptomyces roseirectus]|uniref:Amino acid adenylation domain-containing protein n=1 Tax=Streptomyces roseirectus TaxID=2768066 RepID=A0A7H0IQF4_9ACTN|nr:amino acid adenylation domain-containing protein [Streptomyces roseirectus]QNP75020.1 amino acid adenylation domain-containing protein [Streptomyces roseirectus]